MLKRQVAQAVRTSRDILAVASLTLEEDESDEVLESSFGKASSLGNGTYYLMAFEVVIPIRFHFWVTL